MEDAQKWHQIEDRWDPNRCGTDTTNTFHQDTLAVKFKDSGWSTVLGKAIVCKETAPKVEWRVKVCSQDMRCLYLGVMLLPQEKLNYNSDNRKHGLLKYMNDDQVVINGSWKNMPKLGGQCKYGEEWSVRIDFEREEILVKRGQGQPVVIAQGHNIATSTFSLQAVMYYEK
mmetsp:Transcript_3454/g.5178  ORF Transcript_3454/g.5178 Transcript_3454/m.5178 type:complete len:171 (-) Transcript_3454:803-1315(-)